MTSFNFSQPGVLSVLATIIAIAISQIEEPGELNIIGEFLSSVGDLVSLEAAKLELQQSKHAK